MFDQKQSHHFGILHCQPHQIGIIHRFPVVRKRQTAGLFKLKHIHQFFILLAFGNGADRNNIHQPNPPAFLDDPFDQHGIINDRTGVRHAHDCGNSTLGRSHRTGCNGFFIFPSGFAKMHVNIHQPRQNQLAAGVDNFVFPVRYRRGNLFYLAVFDQNILRRLDGSVGINDSGVLYKHPHNIPILFPAQRFCCRPADIKPPCAPQPRWLPVPKSPSVRRRRHLRIIPCRGWSAPDA